MQPRPRIVPILVVQILAACLAVVACSSPKNDPGPGGPSAIVPWTQEFEEHALLIANSVRIEGPVGLLEHIATRPNPEFHDRVERTTVDGFLQEIESRFTGQGSEIFAWLDKLELVALHRLTVLERPSATDVVVEASGDVFLRRMGSGEDGAAAAGERHETLRLVGRPPRWPE